MVSPEPLTTRLAEDAPRPQGAVGTIGTLSPLALRLFEEPELARRPFFNKGGFRLPELPQFFPGSGSPGSQVRHDRKTLR